MSELRGNLPKRTKLLYEIGGVVLILVVWQLVAMRVNSIAIFPTPLQVLGSLPELHFQDLIVVNTLYSIKINLLGYLWAIALALPLGFALGLFAPLGAIFNRILEAIRYIPLTAVTGLFIAWFGIYMNMKVQFLAFGIFVYLLPVVVERVRELDDVYVQTAQTLGGPDGAANSSR